MTSIRMKLLIFLERISCRKAKDPTKIKKPLVTHIKKNNNLIDKYDDFA